MRDDGSSVLEDGAGHPITQTSSKSYIRSLEVAVACRGHGERAKPLQGGETGARLVKG